jgi:nucleotide-binding universal stress UspA family protein
MYAHMLVPTDGSEFSEKAALQAVQFAKQLGSKVTFITVSLPWHSVAVGEVAVVLDEKDYEIRTENNAWACLNRLTDVAKKEGVPRNAIHLRSPRAYRAIIEAAAKEGCDLIVMGSHGRRGIEGALLGSETTRVLTHCQVPVLVLRPE